MINLDTERNAHSFTVKRYSLQIAVLSAGPCGSEEVSTVINLDTESNAHSYTVKRYSLQNAVLSAGSWQRRGEHGDQFGAPAVGGEPTRKRLLARHHGHWLPGVCVCVCVCACMCVRARLCVAPCP